MTGNLTRSDVFPARLAASADPGGLRLLPTASPDRQDNPEEELATDPPETEEPEVAASLIS